MDGLLSTEDLRVRWRMATRKTVRLILKRYGDIFNPVKVGKQLLVEEGAVRKFEEGRRVYKVTKEHQQEQE